MTKPLLPIALILASIVYMASARTFDQFAEIAVPMALIMSFAIASFVGIRWGMFGRPKFSIHTFLLPLYVLIASAAIATIYYSMWVVISDGYLWIHSLSPPRFVHVIFVGILVLLTGIILFLFRLKARFFFGLSEVLFGFLVALWKIPENSDPITWNLDIVFVMLTASIFLIVRGLDNMHAGLTSSPDAFLEEFRSSEYGQFMKVIESKKDKIA